MAVKKVKLKSGIRWYAQVYAGTDSSGKEVYDYGKYRDRQSEAKEDELLLLQQRERRRIIGKKGQRITTFADALAAFKTSRKYEKYSTRTKKDFTYYETRTLLPIFGDARLTVITTLVIERWISEMEKIWSPTTWAKPYGFFKTVMQFCRRSGYISLDPCLDVEINTSRPTGKALNTQADIDLWTPAQIDSFLDWEPVKQDIVYPMLKLSFALGLRPGEVCGLKIGGLKTKSIRLEKGIDADGNETNLKTPLSHRDLPITPEMYTMLSCLVSNRKAKKDAQVFVLKNGNVIRPPVYSRHFKKLLIKYNETHPLAPLPDMPLYHARHSWSTNAKFVYHVDPSIRAAVLGHSTIDTSDQNYTQITTDTIRTALFESR